MSAVPAATVEVPHGRGKPRARVFDWPQIAAVSPVLAATMLRYLDQIALSLRPASVVAANGKLRQFAGFLTTEFPEIGGLADVNREHVEAFKRHLGTRLSRNDTGQPLSPVTIRLTLGTLRTFFERVSEWDYPDAPKRVPLHHQLVEQLDQHAKNRSDDLDRLIVFDGRRLDRHMVARMVRRVAKAAGIGHVHPHQLRHTLATQAINRGMSLEAIAAMLGHKTLRMTLVYARIADRTVADAYDRVTNEVDALYTKPTGLRSAPGGSAAMAHLAAEFDQKLLGNGHCNRPTQLDCQFESICENCAHFSTNTSFVPVLEAQRDHAADRDQHHRVDLFDMLLDRARTEQP